MTEKNMIMAEKNMTIIMVTVCFVKKLKKKKSLLLTHLPALENWAGVAN